jgi:hypothetical protein
MHHRVFRHAPSTLGIADKREAVQAQDVGERSQVIDPALQPVLDRAGRIGLAEAPTESRPMTRNESLKSDISLPIPAPPDEPAPPPCMAMSTGASPPDSV